MASTAPSMFPKAVTRTTGTSGARYLDPPAQRAGGFAADGQPQAGALALGLGGVEGLEDALALLRADARAGVGHRERQLVAGLLGAQLDAAALRHGVDCVGDEV